MNPYLLPALECGPATLRRLLPLVPTERLDEALEPDRFTPREVMAHLADWEPIIRARIQSAVTAPGSAIELFDESEMALANGYANSDAEEMAETFRRERRITADYVRTLGPGNWTKTVVHPDRGLLTAEDLANLRLGHDFYHTEQISAYLPTT